MKNCELSTIDFFKKLKEVFPEFTEWTEKDVVEIRNFLKKEDVVLDVGCGWAREIKELAPFCKKIIGIDNDLKEIETAKSYLKDVLNVELFVEDAKKIYFPDESFDIIIAVGNTFGNLGDDKEIVLQEMKRLVKKEGKILVAVSSKGALPKRLEAFKKVGLEIKRVDDGKIMFEDGLISEEFSKEELTDLFEKNGLKVSFIDFCPIGVLCVASK